MSERQEILDTFYFTNGKCCAGCDWWRSLSSLVGECIQSPPVSGDERLDMLGVLSSSMRWLSGHVVTGREHVCGEFKDAFDWQSLPVPYLKRIGFVP